MEENKEYKQSITFQVIKDELRLFYYENQYDEEKYSHFRACDKHIEYDIEGVKYISYYYLD